MTWPQLRYRRSLASRVIWLTTLAVGATVTVVAVAAYLTVRSQSMDALDESLRNRASRAAEFGTLEALSQQAVPPFATGAADVTILFLDASHHTIRGTSTHGATQVGAAEFKVASGQLPYSARTVMIDGTRCRMVAVPAARGEALILAQSLAPTEQLLDRLGLVMLVLGALGMAAAGFAGWMVATTGLRPVRRLTGAVEEIARTERLEPIEVEGNDEVARLAMAFNALVATVSASQSRQRQLVADAGHELRTPLTSLRTNLDLLAQEDSSRQLSPEARRELMDDVRGQIGEMTTLIVDLIELARDDPPATTVEPVELTAILSQAVTRVRRRAVNVNFEVDLDPWWVRGDAAALERAITNLLDNAVKWSPDGGVVQVRLTQGTVVVADGGPGIADEDLPYVFERFYRSTESRGMPGSGLGLSIVQAVAERHGGSVRAGTAPGGGASLWFAIPGSADPAEVLAGS